MGLIPAMLSNGPLPPSSILQHYIHFTFVTSTVKSITKVAGMTYGLYQILSTHQFYLVNCLPPVCLLAFTILVWSISKALQLLLICLQDECLVKYSPFVYLLTIHHHSSSSGQSLHFVTLANLLTLSNFRSVSIVLNI